MDLNAWKNRGKYLKEIVQRFNVPLVQIPLLPRQIKGLKMLTELGEQIYDTEEVDV